MNSKIPVAPVPMFRTANNIDEALAEIKAHLYPYDENTVHSLVMMYHNTLIQQMWEAARNAKRNCTMGVGDGSGNLFIHGDYESIKAAQNILLQVVHVPAGRTVNCEPTRYLETSEVMKLLRDNGIYAKLEESED